LHAMQKNINILNKRARFDYEIIETYTAGMVLTGTEIKSIRLGKANITEGFCEFSNGELFAINTQIEEYAFGNQFNHKAKSERKLLLNKKELKSLEKAVDTKGLTIVPLKLFTNEKGIAKLDIALCRGKKTYDKRESLKEADTKRDLDRIKKEFRR
jgi:SsrA-binding protein